MKNIKFFFALLISSLFIVSSCSIEKRLHRSGYHVAWKNSQSNQQKSDSEKLLAIDNESQDESQAFERISKLKSKEVYDEVAKKELVPEKETKVPSVKDEPQFDKNKNNHFINKSGDKEKSLVKETFETKKNSEVQFNSEKSQSSNGTQDDVMFILLILLCLIIPPLAVYLITEDIKTTLISLLLTLLFWLPGVIFAFYILFTRY